MTLADLAGGLARTADSKVRWRPDKSLTTAQALARWIGADPAPLALTAATHSA